MTLFQDIDETKKYCQEVLNETEESRRDCLEALNQWIQENPALHIRSDQDFLISFLRCCKFDLEKTKTKLTNYSHLRRDAPEWFTNRDPLLPEIKELVELGVFVPLKYTFEHQLVVIIKTGAHNPKNHKQDNVFKAGKMVLDVAAQEIEESQIYGVIAIFDMNGVGFGHARQLTPSIIKKAVFAWQNYHVRPKKLEFINAPRYINVVLNIFKGYMSSKLKGRVQVHFNGLHDLHRVIPKELLPREYGGHGEDLKELTKYWHEKLVAYTDWFKDDERYRAD